MNKYKLVSEFKLHIDQNNAVNKILDNFKNNINYQVLLGVTGSGKTFTIANVLKELNLPALVISHNKTLAAQLYQEFRDFFPINSVNYFVSYYDYYQPEAYIPKTDTYIEKDADINELIDKLRLKATSEILSRNDVICISSVSCIYNLGSPKNYKNVVLSLKLGDKASIKSVIEKLINLQYERTEYGFTRGTFRVRGEHVDIYLSYNDNAIRLEFSDNKIVHLEEINPISGDIISRNIKNTLIFPSKHFVTESQNNENAFIEIKNDLKERYEYFIKKKKLLEANRIKQKVEYDLEMIRELGYVKGIENYSRYFDGRKIGDAPYTLIDYYNYKFKNKWILIVDESHITFPQIRGMYAGDLSRKNTLIEYGFRLPSSTDNRPLKFDEFLRKIPNFIATSATPADWENSFSYEKSKSKRYLIKQLVRPTGIPDPKITIRPTEYQVKDVIEEVLKRKIKKQRTLITTLTKKTAEILSEFLEEKGLKVTYIHSSVDTLKRNDILDDLRNGRYDCLVGVNLLREGLDLPEVGLVAILDADKEGFLRSKTSLIQTMGRAARHVEGEVILYADKITNSIKCSVDEVNKRRKYQIDFNKKYDIIPKSIKKPIRNKLVDLTYKENNFGKIKLAQNALFNVLDEIKADNLTPMEKKKTIKVLTREMKNASNELNFELAAELRDKINELK